MTALLKLESKKDTPCIHPALKATGPDVWECLICHQKNITAIDLIDQRNERRKAKAASN